MPSWSSGLPRTVADPNRVSSFSRLDKLGRTFIFQLLLLLRSWICRAGYNEVKGCPLKIVLFSGEMNVLEVLFCFVFKSKWRLYREIMNTQRNFLIPVVKKCFSKL